MRRCYYKCAHYMRQDMDAGGEVRHGMTHGTVQWAARREVSQLVSQKERESGAGR